MNTNKNKVKKIVLSILFVVLIATSCSKAKVVNKEINESEIKNICNLATLEIKFNNVVKCREETDYNIAITTIKAVSQAWAEYQGSVKVGIDMKEVHAEFDSVSNKVTITLPKAKVLSEPTDNISEIQDEFFHYSKNWISQKFAARITSDSKQRAIAEAKENMIQTIESNNAILLQAQNRAKILIENFINLNGDYEIEWILD